MDFTSGNKQMKYNIVTAANNTLDIYNNCLLCNSSGISVPHKHALSTVHQNKSSNRWGSKGTQMFNHVHNIHFKTQMMVSKQWLKSWGIYRWI